jgi:hypothetical protein
MHGRKVKRKARVNRHGPNKTMPDFFGMFHASRAPHGQGPDDPIAVYRREFQLVSVFHVLVFRSFVWKQNASLTARWQGFFEFVFFGRNYRVASSIPATGLFHSPGACSIASRHAFSSGASAGLKVSSIPTVANCSICMFFL